jgi:hypothetical protein
VKLHDPDDRPALMSDLNNLTGLTGVTLLMKDSSIET